jgi:hypothetical protein
VRIRHLDVSFEELRFKLRNPTQWHLGPTHGMEES